MFYSDTIPELPGQTVRTLSVSAVNRLARELLEGHFPAVLVEGEISNLSMPASGHWYLTLKDESAQLRCAMFRNRNQRLGFRPRNGMQVLVKGRLSLYEGRGDYQLIADSMEEAGAGALRRAFELLKARLAQEGLFDPAYKREIANHYHHIGIITSPTGAAIHDMLTAFRRRFPATAITLFPVAVQGNDAPGEIVRALQTANRLRGKLGIEALIVGRGGGSLEDLQAFNDEAVARAIHASELPVVSAVGHEIDFSIADFVADLRAATPSAAAELMSPDQQDYRNRFNDYAQQFADRMRQRLQSRGRQLEFLQRQLKHPGRRLQEQAQTLDLLEARLRREVRNQLKQRTTALSQLARNLTAISPLQTLARGYSISYGNNQAVLRSSDNISPGDTLITRLSRGSLTSTVTSVNPDGSDTGTKSG